MTKIFLALLLTVLCASAFAAPETTLYAGKAAAQSDLSVAAWGAGSGQDSTDVYLFGGHSLKITTLDLYQGARISFNTPVPLDAGESGRTFQLTFRRGAPTLHYDPRTLPGAESPAGAGAASSAASGGNGEGAMPSGMGSSNYPGQGSRRRGRRRPNPDGTATVDAGPPVTIPQIENLHLLFTLADGRQADILRPVPETSDDTVGEGWYSVSVPLSALKFPGGAPGTLQSVTIGGDQFGIFYVGRMRLATDTAPIAVSIDGLETAAPGEPVTLRAKADGGLSALQYSWNFDGGTAEQASGQETTTQFPTAGRDYTVTLTVSDLDGIKKSVQATKKIHVTEDEPQGQQMNGAPFDPRQPAEQR